MRIVSKFRDYYDGVQQFGQDDVVYIRERKTVSVPGYCGYDEIYVGFTGKIYPILKPTYNSKHCLKIEDVDKVVESDSLFDKMKQKIYHESDERGRLNGRFYSGLSRRNLIRWFANDPVADLGYQQERANWHKKLTEIFDRHHVPIFTIKWASPRGSVDMEFNSCLRPLELYRVLPPFQAFQELSMWLSNQARPIKEPPPIDDKTMAEIKGFDRFSFRKPRQSR